MMTLTKLLRALPLLLVLGGCALMSDPDAQDTNASAAELYQEARSAMRAGNYHTAIERLETLQSRYPFGEHAQQAQLDIMYAYFKTDEWDAAITAADRFIRLNPTHPRVDYALYMRGTTNMNRGLDFISRLFEVERAARDPQPLRQAYNDFQRLVAEFPDTDYAQDAREHMITLRSQLALHELEAARFYQQRAAYVAAANRAKVIIEGYQDTPAVDEALEILADAYQHLDLPDLRQDLLRVIRENYPEHPLAGQPG